MPDLRFKAGNITVATSVAKMTSDSSPCSEVYLRAHGDNANDITISTEALQSDGFILAPGEDVTVSISSPDGIYCEAPAANQVLSWMAKGV